MRTHFGLPNNAHHTRLLGMSAAAAASPAASFWATSLKQLSEELQSSRGNQARALQLLGALNDQVYPIESLNSEVFKRKKKRVSSVFFAILGCGKLISLLLEL